MIYLPSRGASYSEYYSPQEISDHYLSILDPDNLIDSKLIPVDDIIKIAKGKEYNFRIEVLKNILIFLNEIDFDLVEKLHGKRKLFGCNVTQKQYSKIVLSRVNKSSLNKLYDIQRKQFELFSSTYMTQPSLNWIAYFTSSQFFNFPQVLDDLLKTPIGIERIQTLADLYSDRKCFYLQKSPIKKVIGFCYSYSDIQKKSHRLKNAKKTYLEKNPYFKKW
jgi:hypothetical protein